MYLKTYLSDVEYEDNNADDEENTNKPATIKKLVDGVPRQFIKWTGDITYIKTVIGWVYLVVVIDLYNREIIGYAISKRIDTELVKQVLSNAIAKNGTKQGLIFHRDRGCQYASKGYREMLEDNGIKASMIRQDVRMIIPVQKFFCNNKKRADL